MGGLSTWTPIRPFVPMYVKTSFLSNDIKAIREHYEFECDEKSEYWKNNLYHRPSNTA